MEGEEWEGHLPYFILCTRASVSIVGRFGSLPYWEVRVRGGGLPLTLWAPQAGLSTTCVSPGLPLAQEGKQRWESCGQAGHPAVGFEGAGAHDYASWA